MKHAIYISILTLFMACKTNKCQVSEPLKINTTTCPENGECTIELLPNKTLEFKTDNFGILYPEVTEGTNTVLIYTYNRKQKVKRPDGYYREHIYAEFNGELAALDLKNEQLQNIQLHFGRICYCKGETGYYPIKNGSFKLTIPKKNNIEIQLDFTVKNIPQIITELNETISLK
jgi:hypothetical protein